MVVSLEINTLQSVPLPDNTYLQLVQSRHSSRVHTVHQPAHCTVSVVTPIAQAFDVLSQGDLSVSGY